MNTLPYNSIQMSGNLDTIRKVRATIERSGKVEFPKGLDCHVATGLLKQWLTNLPEPLMTYDLYPQFIAVCGNLLLLFAKSV